MIDATERTMILAQGRTVVSISAEGQITLGPDITWDEAAECLLQAFERATGRPVLRATPTGSADR